MVDYPFHLSVVATSRNDNHGKNLLYRMQSFVDGFVHQCEKHRLKAELILVDWNPPSETLPLANALRYPRNREFCSIRIIRVPREVHETLDCASKIPLFQMIGKNVGIRRARGEFVLATNIDILFSDELMMFIKDKLMKGHLYRVDRLDVPEKLPENVPFNEMLKFCSENFFRIHSRIGTSLVSHGNNQFVQAVLKAPSPFPGNRVSNRVYSLTNKLYVNMLRNLKRWIKRVVCFIHPNNSLFLHTNACGDFTLLSSQDWAALKGYPEWNIFSWNIDSILLYQARQHGIQMRSLPRELSIYHIEHEIGSGFSPEGASILSQKLEARMIPYLNDRDLKNHILEMNRSRQKVIYNSDNWGFADLSLEEIIV